jgi:polyphosphate kinase 2 (PPK2 family)
VNLNCFSQPNTNNQSQTKISDTTRVKLKPSTARLAIKDIVKGEGCESELKLTQEKLIKTEEREKEKDSHIILLEEKDKNNNFMLGKKDEQLNVSEDLTKSLHKELKAEKTKTFLWKVGTVVGVLTTSYLLIVR